MFETLETRIMFGGGGHTTGGTTSTGPTAVFSGGTLTITGGASADILKTSENNGTVTVTLAKKALAPFYGVKTLVIHGGAGNDNITHVGNSLGAIIYGDDGDDSIAVTDPPFASGSTMPYSV